MVADSSEEAAVRRTASSGTTRRARTRIAIKVAAREQLRDKGGRGIGMRAVARAVDIPPSSLYRFYPDRAALLAELRVDAYNSLIERLTAARRTAGDRGPAGQWRAITCALRGWAIDSPDQFGLLYSIPMHTEDEWTEPVYARRARAGSVVAGVVADAMARGQLVPPQVGNPIAALVPPWISADGDALDPVSIQITLGAWAALVGHLSLEPHRRAMILDPQTYYEDFVRSVMVAMGFRPNVILQP